MFLNILVRGDIMSFFGFMKEKLFRKKLPELPAISTELKEPDRPNFSEQPFGLGLREDLSSDKMDLLKTKLDLVNAKLDNIDRRLAELERIAEER